MRQGLQNKVCHRSFGHYGSAHIADQKIAQPNEILRVERSVQSETCPAAQGQGGRVIRPIPAI